MPRDEQPARPGPLQGRGDRIGVLGHLLPRLLRLPDETSRTSGPLFLSMRRPAPARRPAAADICPHTGHARLGYDRARVKGTP
ncbi:hypothetical protein [Sphaerisporangium corydalis]|uniref:Rieske domain-containing protein n=1 Tax=Sphaerisporangium corydalis TaxID=1441875 RepID=A0ABV9EF69_9ACTN|nr:hypothetical protein [Sphaerisporangium corydalis]